MGDHRSPLVLHRDDGEGLPPHGSAPRIRREDILRWRCSCRWPRPRLACSFVCANSRTVSLRDSDPKPKIGEELRGIKEGGMGYEDNKMGAVL